MHVSALVRDGGTLQVGIGELGDALVYALLLRHQQSAVYADALRSLGTERFAALVDAEGGRQAFSKGLFASTEMFIDQLLDLYRAGVLTSPRVRFTAAGAPAGIGRHHAAESTTGVLEALWKVGVGPKLSAEEFRAAQHYGVFRRDVEFSAGRMRAEDGDVGDARSGRSRARSQIAAECLGRELRNGQVLHAGFFLGPRGFYAALRDLRESDRSADRHARRRLREPALRAGYGAANAPAATTHGSSTRR